jgi:hypothetical protein
MYIQISLAFFPPLKSPDVDKNQHQTLKKGILLARWVTPGGVLIK